jgi:MFS family permease
VVPLVEGRELGWPWWSIALLLTTPFLVELFRRYEMRLAQAGGEPLVAMDVFEMPGLLRGLGAIMTLYAMAPFFLTFSIYLQTGLGFSAWQAGLAILPFSAGFLTGSSLSAAIGRRLGSMAPSFGFALAVTGTVATSLIIGRFPAGVLPPVALIGPALLLIGLGMGMTIPTMVRVVVERVEPHRAGLVGGMVNSSFQISAAIAIAVLGGLFYTILGPRTDPTAVTHAFSTTLLGIALCHMGGGVLAAGLGQRRPAPRLATCEAKSAP